MTLNVGPSKKVHLPEGVWISQTHDFFKNTTLVEMATEVDGTHFSVKRVVDDYFLAMHPEAVHVITAEMLTELQSGMKDPFVYPPMHQVYDPTPSEDERAFMIKYMENQ